MITAKGHKASAGYRADVDGLRAVAVLAVVIYHIQESLLPGGFAGVDVFFVISGFLITGNLHRQMSEGKFTFKDFYKRRLLRIFPPLIIVILATVLIGQFIMLPEDFAAMTESALASILSVANIYFLVFLDTSYFAADASVHPLLHIWSLGVEEQFYIFWPFLLLAFLKTGVRGLAIMTLIIGTASFTLAELIVVDHPMFAYYMLPTRAGQLMAGALVYFASTSNRFTLHRYLREVLAVLGLMAVVASLCLIDGDIPFPGISALPITLGTAVIIWVGTNVQNKPLINRILGVKPFVWIGLLSYSFYLWHWPVFAYWKYMYGSFGLISGILALLTALGLSYLTYRFVEQRFRRWPGTFPKIVNRTFVLPSLLIGLIFVGTYSTKGHGVYAFTDYPDRLEAHQASILTSRPADYVCQEPRLKPSDLTKARCVINPGKAPPKVLLWGDSNAGHFVGTLAAISGEYGFSFRNIEHSSCPPFIESAGNYAPAVQKENCQASVNLVVPVLKDYDIIVLGAAWNIYIKEQKAGSRDIFEMTVDTLISQGKEVVVISKIPIFKDTDPKCERKRIKRPHLNCRDEGIPLSKAVDDVNNYIKTLAASRPKMHFLDVTTPLCPDGLCSSYIGKTLSYRDGTHLSREGSWELGEFLIKQTGLPDGLLSAPRLSSSSKLGVNGLKTLMQTEPIAPNIIGGDAERIVLFGDPNLYDGARLKWNGERGGRFDKGLFIIEDKSPTKFPQIRTTFSLKELALQLPQDRAVTLEADLSLLKSDTPIFNFQVSVDELSLRQDITYNPKTGSIIRKQGASPENAVVVVNDNNVRLLIKVNGLNPDSQISVKYVVAASQGGNSYQREAVGKAAIKAIYLYGAVPLDK